MNPMDSIGNGNRISTTFYCAVNQSEDFYKVNQCVFIFEDRYMLWE